MTLSEKKVRKPQRTCACCRKKGDQDSFLRVGYDALGVLGLYRIVVGRSTYICKNQECIQQLFEKKRLERTLKRSITEQEKKKLLKELHCKQSKAIDSCK